MKDDYTCMCGENRYQLKISNGIVYVTCLSCSYTTDYTKEAFKDLFKMEVINDDQRDRRQINED